MFERFTDDARKVMALANREALRLNHEYIGTEHILLGLSHEGSGVGANLLRALSTDPADVRERVEALLKPGTKPPAADKHLQATRAEKVIEYAIEEARDLNHRDVGSEHLLLGLLRERDGIAARVLTECGVTVEAVRKLVADKGAAPAAPVTPVTPAPGPSRGLLERFTDWMRSRPADIPLPDVEIERFTDRARNVMGLANQEAKRFYHEYIGTEHILLGLIREGSGVGANVLKNLDVDLRKARIEVEKLVRRGPPMVAAGKLPLTPRANVVIKYAIEEARNLNHNYIGTEHLVLGLLREHDGVAAQVLRNLGLTLEEVREEVLNLLGAAAPETGSAAAYHVVSALVLPDCPLCQVTKDLESNPLFIAELSQTNVVLSDNQCCPGWCVLILKDHQEHVADLPVASQLGLWLDVNRVAAAIRDAFPTSGKDGGPPRINYECLGNQVPHIHWHLIPRHADDPEPTKPVWGRSEAALRGTMSDEERQRLAVRLGLLVARPSGP